MPDLDTANNQLTQIKNELAVLSTNHFFSMIKRDQIIIYLIPISYQKSEDVFKIHFPLSIPLLSQNIQYDRNLAQVDHRLKKHYDR